MGDFPTFNEIQKRLGAVTQEMLGLIHKYQLDVEDPFQVIEHAREKITDQQDYIRFLELSVEGRIYGDAGAALEKAEREAAGQARQ